MGKYSCEKCTKIFSQKSHYDQHIKRKKPCYIETDKLKKIIDKAVEEKLNEISKIINITNNETITKMNEENNIYKMNKKQLLDKCKEFGIKKYSSKNKSELITLINSKNNFIPTQIVNVVKSSPNLELNQRRIKSAPADSHSSWSMTDKYFNSSPLGQNEIFSGLNDSENNKITQNRSKWIVNELTSYTNIKKRLYKILHN